MPRKLGNLTPLKIEKAHERGIYGDGRGLYLQVTSAGGRSWLFCYRLRGKSREMGLGSLKAVKLAAARKLRDDYLALLARGIDPIDERKRHQAAAALEAAKSITFKACAKKHIEAHRAGWRNAKHAAQWESTLETYAYPVLGDLAVNAVVTELVKRVLEQPVKNRAGKGTSPLWRARPETASRLRGRIEAVLGYATAHGYRTGDNPARWRGHLDKLLPKRSKVATVKHHAALPYDDLPAFMRELKKQGGIAARALEFTILTAARTGEVIRAKRSEFDRKSKVWTVPAERMKAHREHRVPLCDRALDILEGLKPLATRSGYVFAGSGDDMPLSNMAMLALLHRMGRNDLTVHGFRSTFRDWAAERTAFPREVAEAALAHTVADKVEAAYRRGDLFDKRRRMMEAWERYCYAPKSSGEVVQFA